MTSCFTFSEDMYYNGGNLERFLLYLMHNHFSLAISRYFVENKLDDRFLFQIIPISHFKAPIESVKGNLTVDNWYTCIILDDELPARKIRFPGILTNDKTRLTDWLQSNRTTDEFLWSFGVWVSKRYNFYFLRSAWNWSWYRKTSNYAITY